MSRLKSHDVPDNVTTDRWTLHIHGDVSRPLQLDEEALTEFPTETFTDEFACVEGWVTAGLTWRGIPLVEILDRAGPAPHSQYALVHALDGNYACSFPLSRLREALLAIELDGESLPLEHGGPARLIPTGAKSDCWESIKWVAEIEVTTSPHSEDDTAKEIAVDRIDQD